MSDVEDFGIESMQISDEKHDFSAAVESWRSEAKSAMGTADQFFTALNRLVEGKDYGSPFFFDSRIAFRPGEITLWAGQNGSGKSMITGQMASNFAMRGERTLICSFEMAPERTLFRMLRQAMGKYPKPCADTAIFMGRWLRWLKGGFGNKRQPVAPLLWLSKCRAGINPDIVCGMIAVACEEYQCKQIIIDNLTKVVSGEDNYNGQKNFVADLTQLAQDYGAHIHLVAHVRKGSNESDAIDKFSVRGASAITDLADNVMLIQRNFDKLRKLERGMLSPEEDKQEPDSYLRLAKQRNGDCQSALIKLWFDTNAACFCKEIGGQLPVLCPDWVADSDQTDREDDCPF